MTLVNIGDMKMTASRPVRLFFMAFLLSILMPLTAISQVNYDIDVDYQAARQMLIEGKVAAALPTVRRAAEDGYAKAQFNMGALYYDGRGVVQSYSEARKWMTLSAENGFSRAQTFIGKMYLNGEGGAASVETAKRFFERAAAGGDGSAYFQLARLYEDGNSVPKNMATALKHYQQASDHGNMYGSYNAGHILLFGDGNVPANKDLALKYMEKSAAQGSTSAQYSVGYVYQTGIADVVDFEKARDYFYQAEASGHPSASNALEHLETRARETAYDLQKKGEHIKSASAFRQICNMGDQEGCLSYGLYLANGAKGFPADRKSAIYYLKKPCEYGIKQACENYYFSVLKTGKSAGKSVIAQTATFYKDACDAKPKNYAACYNLAYMHYYTVFDMGNYEQAKRLSVDACFNGGNQSACPMAMHIMNEENRMRGPVPEAKKRSALGSALGDFLGTLSEGMVAMSNSGYNYSSQSYTSGTSTSFTPPSSSNAWQDKRDFENAISAINSIGTGYNSSCRPGNPYC